MKLFLLLIYFPFSWSTDINCDQFIERKSYRSRLQEVSQPFFDIVKNSLISDAEIIPAQELVIRKAIDGHYILCSPERNSQTLKGLDSYHSTCPEGYLAFDILNGSTATVRKKIEALSKGFFIKIDGATMFLQDFHFCHHEEELRYPVSPRATYTKKEILDHGPSVLPIKDIRFVSKSGSSYLCLKTPQRQFENTNEFLQKTNSHCLEDEIMYMQFENSSDSLEFQVRSQSSQFVYLPPSQDDRYKLLSPNLNKASTTVLPQNRTFKLDSKPLFFNTSKLENYCQN